MTALTRTPFTFFNWTFRNVEASTDCSAKGDDVERRKVVADMIAAGACESEYGVQMLMSVYPQRF